MMFRTRLTGTISFAPAAYLVLAVLFALRCSVAWAAADVHTSGGPPELAISASAPARTHAVSLAAVRPAPARCEAVNDDPPAPCSSSLGVLRWSAPAAPSSTQSRAILASAPAPLPPARGPPPMAA